MPPYVKTGEPAIDSGGQSDKIRNEFALIEADLNERPLAVDQKKGFANTQMTDSGAADAYAISVSYITSPLTAGMSVIFKAANANTGASTLNVSGLGAVAIKTLAGSALTTGDILAGGVYICMYDGTNWILLNRDNAGTSETNAAASAAAAALSATSAATSAATATAYGGMVLPMLLQ